ncbi:amino acid ABC transporter permease [Rubrimonas cliftonensis]|uniref:Amino acid ABC transporter membrane protein 2, PAAT family n=1 Tax=Rubrimonas cliftonensis TaxID=89524 RepID=A0A1H3YNB5_9RHOB|nr:amino acid ABC transporter permease [Rubrimonas cliftonensis]SEA12983.1 amino acid ABC transporter membrane protein 2, PAAT family [Rubrimonas cliftonensis]
MLDSLIAEAPRFFTYWNLKFLLEAALTTLALTAAGCVGGFALGFLMAALRRTEGAALWPLRALCLAVTETFRRVPFLVTLFLVFYLFEALKLGLDTFHVALAAVVVIAGAYIAEIVRAGFESVHQNQWDAAAAMNFGLATTLRHVVLPQAWKVILPPAFSFFILFIKDTALASQIGVVELTYAGKVLNNKGFSAVLTFGAVLALYFLMSYPLTRLGRHVEARLATRRTR